MTEFKIRLAVLIYYVYIIQVTGLCFTYLTVSIVKIRYDSTFIAVDGMVKATIGFEKSSHWLCMISTSAKLSHH